jgi:hypothetical protein
MSDPANRPPSQPITRPLTEGYVIKGGHNPGVSQITTRPAAPAAINSKPAAATPPPAEPTKKQ